MAKKSYPTNTLARGLKVFEALAEIFPKEGANLQQIAEISGQNRSNVYRYLETLCELDWLDKDESTYRYRIGPKLLQMAAVSLNQFDFREIARPVLEELVKETGLTAHLSVMNGKSIVYIDKVESDSPIQMRSRLGMNAPCYSTAMGKAMLATYSKDEINNLIPEKIERRTPKSKTTREELLKELAMVRQVGYATDMEENERDIACAGAVLIGYDNEMIGAISLSGLAQDVTEERVRSLGPRLVEVADEISRRLGRSPNAAVYKGAADEG